MNRSHKNKHLMLIFGVVLAVMIAAAVAIVLWPNAKTDDKEPALFSFDAGSVTSVVVSKGGNELELVKEQDAWVSKLAPGFPVNSSLVDTKVKALAALTYSRKLTNEESAAVNVGDQSFGIKAALSGGGTVSIDFYSLNKQTLSYYAKINGETTVYMVGDVSADALSFTLYDVADLDNPTAVLSSQVQSLRIKTPDGRELTLIYEAGGNETVDYSKSKVWFYTVDGSPLRAASTAAGTAVLDAFQNIVNEQLASYDTSDSQRHDYGFDGGCVEAELKYVDTDGAAKVRHVQYVLSDVGSMTPAQRMGTGCVYFVESELVRSLISAANADLEPHEVMDVSLDSVKAFTVSYGGASRRYTLSSAKGDDGNKVYSLYDDAGVQKVSDNFIKLYYGITSLSVQSVGGRYSGEAVLTIVFETDSASYREITFAVYGSDSSFYASVTEDDAPLLLNRRSVDPLLAYAAELVK